MNGGVVAGILMGAFAILVGAGWITGAILSRRNRAAIAETYRATGGIFYTAAQIGCSTVLIVFGIAILVVVALHR